MKISEMNNEQAAETLIRLSVPLGNICDDERMVRLFEKYQKIDDKTPFVRTFGRMLPDSISYALKEHKEDLYEIVGALTFKKIADVAKMNFFETIKTLKESYDEVLRDFFTSSVQQIKENVKASSGG